jgi:hypothetical protein
MKKNCFTNPPLRRHEADLLYPSKGVVPSGEPKGVVPFGEPKGVPLGEPKGVPLGRDSFTRSHLQEKLKKNSPTSPPKEED